MEGLPPVFFKPAKPKLAKADRQDKRLHGKQLLSHLVQELPTSPAGSDSHPDSRPVPLSQIQSLEIRTLGI